MNGRVGIGTDTPEVELDVSGTINTSDPTVDPHVRRVDSLGALTVTSRTSDE